MATIYLSHPKHGVKIATMEMEAQYDEMNGWSRFEPEGLTQEPSGETLPVVAPPEELPPTVKLRLRGRPRGRPRAIPAA